MPSIWDDLVMAIEAIVHAAEGMLHLTGPAASRRTGRTAAPGDRPLADQPRAAPGLRCARRGPRRHPSRRAHDAARSGRPPARSISRHSSGCSSGRRTGCWRTWTTWPPGSTALRRAVIELDLGLTLVIGCLRDGVPTDGYEAIDGEDARAWFARHGAAPSVGRLDPDPGAVRPVPRLRGRRPGASRDRGRRRHPRRSAPRPRLQGRRRQRDAGGHGRGRDRPDLRGPRRAGRQVRVLPPGRAAGAERQPVAGRADPHRPPGRR